MPFLQHALLLLLMTFTSSPQSLLCNSVCILRAIITLKQKDIQQASTSTAYIETLGFTRQPEMLFQIAYSSTSLLLLENTNVQLYSLLIAHERAILIVGQSSHPEKT